MKLTVEYVGLTQKPLEDEFGNIQFLTNSGGKFTVMDKQGIPVNVTYELEPFNAAISADQAINSLRSYTFEIYSISGNLEPGNYVLNYSIIDNLSGKKLQASRDFVIEGAQVANGTSTIPGSS